jgi:plastocyanin
MRRVLLPLLLAALWAPSSAFADDTIALVPGGLGFRPNSVTVHAGERVVWRNDDRVPRRVLGDNDAFSTPLLRPGQSAVVRFSEIGTFGYRDAARPGLRGAVVVAVAPHVVTIRASATTVPGGGQVVFTGTVSPARRGERVQLLRIEADGSVNILDSTLTRRGGQWSIATAVTAAGVYRMRWGPTESRPIRIRVRR